LAGNSLRAGNLQGILPDLCVFGANFRLCFSGLEEISLRAAAGKLQGIPDVG
jgi:hypothetical protein